MDIFEQLSNSVMFVCPAKDPEKQRIVTLVCNSEYKNYLDNTYTNHKINYVMESNHSDYPVYIIFGIKFNILINEDFNIPVVLVEYK
jgi:hypothetical protein